MKSLLLGLLLGTSAAYSQQSYSCETKMGYSCQESTVLPGKFSRNALCFAYGEEIVSLDQNEENKIFSSIESCQNIAVDEADCEITSFQHPKVCAEAGGEFLFTDSACLQCK